MSLQPGTLATWTDPESRPSCPPQPWEPAGRGSLSNDCGRRPASTSEGGPAGSLGEPRPWGPPSPPLRLEVLVTQHILLCSKDMQQKKASVNPGVPEPEKKQPHLESLSS